jgi:two-component system OmpR family response regulator
MRLLIVEDDSETAAFIIEAVTVAGYEIEHVLSGRDGLRRAETEPFDVLIIDCLLPDIDGFSLVAELRLTGVMQPVLMLTALGAIEDRVRGLRSGADDYLVKPFAIAELVARIEALARRGGGSVMETSVCGTIKIDRLRREVWREGKRIVVQPREFELLEQLVRQPDQTVSRGMLLERVWHFHFDPQTNIVETHMSRLRQKLNAGFETDAIRTVRGVGYMLRSDA